MKITDLYTCFEITFNSQCDQNKLNALILAFGVEKLTKVLTHLMINGVNPPLPGKRNNPYGLIFSMAVF